MLKWALWTALTGVAAIYLTSWYLEEPEIRSGPGYVNSGAVPARLRLPRQ